VRKINIFELLIFISLIFLLVVFGSNLIFSMKEEFFRNKITNELKVFAPLLSLIYYIQGSISSTIKTIQDNRYIFKDIGNQLTKSTISYLFYSRGNDAKNSLNDYLQTYLNSIFQETEKVLNNVKEVIDGLEFEVELFEQRVLSIDDKISLILFLDFFIPFIIVFFAIFNQQYFRMTMLFFLSLSFLTTYYTSRLMKQ